MTGQNLAIVGGGASAIILLAHLARTRTIFERIDIYDRKDAFGKGIAYGTTCPAHRLNVRAAGLSAFADEPDDFAEFAARHGYVPNDFVPRYVYADYLKEKMEEVRHQLPLRFLKEDVLSVRREEGGYSVETGEYVHIYDQAVLATGNVRPLAPDVMNSIDTYLQDPWDMDALRRLSGMKHIAIIGSGLSAADAIVALDAASFEGLVTVVSRNGWFPCEHAMPLKHPSFFEADGQAPADAMNMLRKEIRKNPDVPWQSIIDAMRHATNDIWQGWSLRQRSSFRRHALTLWNIHRHRMPPETASVIARLKREGRLSIVRDKILRIEAPCRLIGRNHMIEADAAINALGYGYEEGRAFDASYRIGPAAFGELFETTAIPEIRAQAAEIAAALSR